MSGRRHRQRRRGDCNREETVKTIVSISLGPRSDDYAFETEFLGQDFEIRRMGTNGSDFL